MASEDGMIEILIAVCMISDHSRCKDVALLFDNDGMSVRDCTLNGQTTIARWSDNNPGWQVARWTCTVAGSVPKS
jgi:hypothetical protein